MEIEQTLEEQLVQVDAKIAFAVAEQGDLEVRDAYIEKAEIYLKHGDKENYRQCLFKAIDKTAGISKKLEYYMMILHSYFIEHNFEKFEEYLKICKKLNEEGGDWEKKNKLLVYEGILYLTKKEPQQAATTFLSCINTFNAPEVINYETLINYAVLLSALTLPRKEITEKIINNSEVLAVLFEDKTMNDFLFSLYNSKYDEYFRSFLRVNDEFIKKDFYLRNNEKLIIKKARIVIYTQYLESYKTVTLTKMAKDFSVSPQYMDKELSELISSRKLNCKIDKVHGFVESIKKDEKIGQFKQIMKKGDQLIERLSKLARMAHF